MKNRKQIKLFAVTLFLLVTMFSTKKIYADIGMVNWDPYYAWITNKEGITKVIEGYKDKTYHIPYGARIYVWHGDYDTSYNPNSSYFVQYKDVSFSFSNSISGKEFRPLSKNPDSSLLTYEDIKLYVFGNISVYDGPDDSYKKIDTVDKGVILTSDYNDGMWAHIYSDNIEGWVYYKQLNIEDNIPKCYVINDDNNRTLILNGELSLFDDVTNKTEIALIPAGKELEYNGHCASILGKKYYKVTYNGSNGFIQDNDKVIETHYKGVVGKSNDIIVLYDQINNNESVVAIIENGEDIELIFSVEDIEGNTYYYCNYENKTGWTNKSPNLVINGESTTSENISIDHVDEQDNSDEELRIKSFPGLIWYFVIGVMMTSLSSYVLIKYLNNRKKK